MSFEESEHPEREAEWNREQRANVLEYLAGAGVAQADVPREPTWSASPHLAIWPVRSSVQPHATGWWVISGDVPTDYVSSSEIPNERAAMRVFARRWMKASRRMARGEKPEDFQIGRPNEWKSLAPMLASRAKLLAEWAADDDLWS